MKLSLILDNLRVNINKLCLINKKLVKAQLFEFLKLITDLLVDGICWLLFSRGTTRGPKVQWVELTKSHKDLKVKHTSCLGEGDLSHFVDFTKSESTEQKWATALH